MKIIRYSFIAYVAATMSLSIAQGQHSIKIWNSTELIADTIIQSQNKYMSHLTCIVELFNLNKGDYIIHYSNDTLKECIPGYNLNGLGTFLWEDVIPSTTDSICHTIIMPDPLCSGTWQHVLVEDNSSCTLVASKAVLDSLLHGIFSMYYLNGQLEKRIIYEKGIPVDSSIFYYENGQLKSFVQYLNKCGQRKLQTTYYPNGAIHRYYNHESQSGIAYYINGSIQSITTYQFESDSIKQIYYFNEAGMVIEDLSKFK